MNVFLATLLTAYGTWRYVRKREKDFIYSTLGFTFLTLSMLFQLFSLTWWSYVMQLGMNYRLFELFGIGFFAAFAICTVLGLSETSKDSK